MREITGNIWDFHGQPSTYICIPINTDVKRNGRAVMGRGVAAQAKHKFPGIDLTLGRIITRNPLVAVSGQVLTGGVLTFITKQHWFDPSTLALIQSSAIKLEQYADAMPTFSFYLPRPGCGNGGLRWEDVRPIIAPILSDNVIVISKATQ